MLITWPLTHSIAKSMRFFMSIVKANAFLLLGVKVGVYGIARAGFPKGGARLREERVSKIWSKSGIEGYSKEIDQVNPISRSWFTFSQCVVFSLNIFQKDQLIHYLILFEYLLKTSVNQTMICISRFIPSIINTLLLYSSIF